jgi:hypothetical protein
MVRDPDVFKIDSLSDFMDFTSLSLLPCQDPIGKHLSCPWSPLAWLSVIRSRDGLAPVKDSLTV